MLAEEVDIEGIVDAPVRYYLVEQVHVQVNLVQQIGVCL